VTPILRIDGATTARRHDPGGSGSYQCKDKAGRVIYVGKAKSLRGAGVGSVRCER